MKESPSPAFRGNQYVKIDSFRLDKRPDKKPSREKIEPKNKSINVYFEGEKNQELLQSFDKAVISAKKTEKEIFESAKTIASVTGKIQDKYGVLNPISHVLIEAMWIKTKNGKNCKKLIQCAQEEFEDIEKTLEALQEFQKKGKEGWEKESKDFWKLAVLSAKSSTISLTEKEQSQMEKIKKELSIQRIKQMGL